MLDHARNLLTYLQCENRSKWGHRQSEGSGRGLDVWYWDRLCVVYSKKCSVLCSLTTSSASRSCRFQSRALGIALSATIGQG